VKVFGCRPLTVVRHTPGAGVRKPSHERTIGVSSVALAPVTRRGSQPRAFRLPLGLVCGARSMLSLIGIAVVVLVAFALFVLRTEAIERTRDIGTAKRAR
jgi:hypothetical protein